MNREGDMFYDGMWWDDCVETTLFCEWLTLLTDNDVQFFFAWMNDYFQVNEKIAASNTEDVKLTDDDDELCYICLSNLHAYY